jgi:uncharacterized protein (DUF433 family)
MSVNLDSLKAEISQLKRKERATLAKYLISTFDKEEDFDATEAWINDKPSLVSQDDKIQSKYPGAVFQIEHPYITCHPDYCGGNPVIVGTKFPVHSVVNYVLKQGLTPEELVKEFKHLSLAQVYDALSYYYDSPAEIERALLENSQLKEEWGR